MAKPGNRKRHLFAGIEPLESRQMLAADCELFSSVPTVSVNSVNSADVQALSSDAGGSLATAKSLGPITGEYSLSGTLGGYDRLDVFKFENMYSGDVGIELTGLSRNANLYLLDANGRLIDSSRLSGRSSESIDVDLAVGQYFVAVSNGSFRYNTYQLSIDASAKQPAPVVDPSPTPTPTPTADPAPTTPTTPAPSAGGDNTVAPFSDVGYFGGRQDWNLNAINAPESWAEGFNGQGVTVAIVDTGVDLDHIDLNDNLWVNNDEIAGNGIDDDGNGFIDDRFGWDFVGRDNNPNDTNGHGTHVAGTVAAEANGVGVTGVAFGATIMPVRVLGGNGYGSTFDVAAGIRYAADNGADIINLSLGGGVSNAIASAINYAGSRGSLVVAAAGNAGASTPGFPAAYSASMSHVLSVGAHSSSDNLAGFSNRVGNSGAVQVDAPGAGITSTFVGGGYAMLSGTSMAAPHVAGLAALALSAAPNLTAPQLRSLLAGGATDTINGSDSIGKANAATTVAFASAGLTSGPGVTSTQVASSLQAGRLSRFMFTTGDVNSAMLPFDVARAADETLKSIVDVVPDLVVEAEVIQIASHDDANASGSVQSDEVVDLVFEHLFDSEASEDLDSFALETIASSGIAAIV